MADSQKKEVEEIYKGCVAGDRRSQKKLFDKFFGLFLGICFRYANNEDEAHDMTQQGFIKIFKKMDSYNGNGSFEGWMRRIIVNTAIDYYRKRDKKTFSIDSTESMDMPDEFGEEDFSEEVLSILGKDRLMDEIASLSPAYRTIFNLYVIEGYTHKEIAEKLTIAEGTSKSNLAKAKSNLRNKLNEILKKHNV